VKLTWEPADVFDVDHDDFDFRMRAASVEVDRNTVQIVISQCAEANWKWTYHLEFDGIVEPDVRVDSEEEIKRLALAGAIAEVRKLLAKLEASE
jgi:hypothetical protein